MDSINKVKTLYRKDIEKSIRSISEYTLDKLLNKNLLYNDEKNNISLNLNSATFNLINYDIACGLEKNLKYIFVTEAYDIENKFPGSGDIFLELIMKYYKNKNKIGNIKSYISSIVENVDYIKKAEKSDIEDLLENFDCVTTKKIVTNIINLASSNSSIFLNDSIQEKCFISKTDKVIFNLEFDNRFFIKPSWTSNNFKFIVIDGFIQEVSEIHHLLMKASETKEDYVLFCKGASEEVKKTILVNLKRGTINIFPVCLKVNEENVNILNDISACLNGDVVSALNGDTISACVRRNLKTGKHIKIANDTITLEILTKNLVNNQKKYLRNKIKTLKEADPNYLYISKRIKNLESDKIEIKIGKIENKSTVKNNIDNFLKFIENCKSGIVVFKNSIFSKNLNNITLKEFIIILKKLKSTVNIINNIDCALISDK